MDPAVLQRALDDILDQGLLRHGFMDYMRDYELVIIAIADPRTGIAPSTLRYLFRHCVRAQCTTTVPADIWRRSLDDRLITDDPGDIDGYVWGVGLQEIYPGAAIVTDSPAARHWTAALGLEFHEVRIQMNAHDLTLVFADLQIEELPPE